MSIDVRNPLESAPIEGLDPRIDDLINERFRRLEKAVRSLQDGLTIDPIYVDPARVYDGMVVVIPTGHTVLGIDGPRVAIYIDDEWRPLAWLNEVTP